MVEYQTHQCYQPLSHIVINEGMRIGEIPSQFYLLFGAMSCPGNGVLNKLQFAHRHGRCAAGPVLLFSAPQRYSQISSLRQKC